MAHRSVLFGAGASLSLLLILFLSSPPPKPPSFSLPRRHCQLSTSTPTPLPLPPPVVDPTFPSFYDDPDLSYTVREPIADWDLKRAQWNLAHRQQQRPYRILMLSGSQPGPCRNPIGDHLLLRFYKNKADYCRLHGIDLFYNDALLDPDMFSFWAKIPVVRAAMVAHPEAEWIWWVDSDAAFTDMEFEPPFEKYANYNLVLHGWPHLVQQRSWTSLNAGVFLIRNCQWSIDFIDRWAKMGPQSPEYDNWGRIQRSIFSDKLYPESDDQTGIIYLLLKENHIWGDKIYLESDYYFEGYWVEIVNKLEKISDIYLDIEKKVKELRQRGAEESSVSYGKIREVYLEKEGLKTGLDGWKRPFVTHFAGCQPCSGDHNKIYSGANCWEGMQKALSFADDQVLRAYGFRHEKLVDSSKIVPVPYDFPADN